MKRHGAFVFLKRIVLSFSNGLFWSKVRRHLARVPLVYGLEQFCADRFCPVNPKRVAFAAFSGGCTCNPKAVARELARRRPDIDIVWLLDYPSFVARKGLSDTGRAVRKSTWGAFKSIATASVMVENAQVFVGVGKPRKRPNQLYINTWHGSLGFKRLDTACMAVIQNARRRSERIDLMLTNSEFEEKVFRESLFPTVPFARVGHPRNDVFFLPERERMAIRDEVYRRIGLDPSKRFVLFAPTFRENAFADGENGYDFEAWARAFEKRFGGEWVVAVRLHPHDAKALNEGLIRFPSSVLNVSSYEDIQELQIAAAAGVTDYSSWLCDYLLGGNPAFIYAPDKAKYDASRGFYYPLESTPFPVSETQEGLLKSVAAFDETKYAADREAFLRRCGCMEDGHASERVVDRIIAHIEGVRA